MSEVPLKGQGRQRGCRWEDTCAVPIVRICEREIFIDNLLVRVHLIIEMI